MDGPLGAAGAGFLLSVRSGFPGVVTPEKDPSYLQGRTGDLLAKVEAPALHGRLRVLLYDSGNRLDAAATAESLDGATDPPSERVRVGQPLSRRQLDSGARRREPGARPGLECPG